MYNNENRICSPMEWILIERVGNEKRNERGQAGGEGGRVGGTERR